MSTARPTKKFGMPRSDSEVFALTKEGQPMVLPAMVVGGGVQWPGGMVALSQGGHGLG